MDVAVSERSRSSTNLSSPRGGCEVMEKPSAEDSSPDEEAPAVAGEGVGDGPKAGERVRMEREVPPDDDVCPICFGEFTVPCKSVCGHWYCANCILTYWSYSATPRPCKCPMCSVKIHRLIPQESLLQLHDEERDKVLREVKRYNLLFVGGIRGAVQKAREMPFCIKRYFQGFFNRAIDPDRVLPLSEMRILITIVLVLCQSTPLQSISTGGKNLEQHMYHIGFAVIIILRLIGILWSYTLARRARRLGNAQPHLD